MRTVASRALAVLRSTWARAVFLLVALAAAVWAVVSQWEAVRAAAAAIPVGLIGVATAVSVVYVLLTMLSWRSALADLGSRLPMRATSQVFLVSQLGKYMPGGVWNIVAAAEIGADHRVPRRRSVSAMGLAILCSIVTGLALAVVAVALAPGQSTSTYRWLLWLLPAFLVALVPGVLNRTLALMLRVARRPALEHPVTAGGVVRASGWALVAWVAAGTQVWLLAGAVGMEPTARTFALAVGGYALAWTVGFLVVVVPAGVGAREAVLAAVLAGQLGAGSVVVVVLLSRVLLTLADLLLGVGALALSRRRRSAGTDAASVEPSREN